MAFSFISQKSTEVGRIDNPVKSTQNQTSWLPITCYLLFLITPLLGIFYLSFQTFSGFPMAPNGELTLTNYARILQSEDMRAALMNSVSYVVINIMITLPIALPAAYAFSRYSFLGDKHIFFAFLACRIVPPVVLIVPVFQLFSALDLVNTPLAIALAHCLFNIPIAIWVLESFISAVPKELDETAFLDGHSLTGFFVKKLMPLIAPGIATAAFFCFMFSWVEVVFARILTVTAGKPISMAIYSLFGYNTDFGPIMAMIVLSLLPGAVLIYFVRHHIAKGFTIK